MPGQPDHDHIEDVERPLLEHLVEQIAHGVPLLQTSCAWLKNTHPTAIAYLFEPVWSEAPAVSMARHADALQEEIGDDPDRLQLSTNELGCQEKNASRQYKRTVAKYGFALKLGFAGESTNFCFLTFIWLSLSPNTVFLEQTWIHRC